MSEQKDPNVRIAELEMLLATNEALLKAAIEGQHTLIRAIADTKTDVEQVAREAWEACKDQHLCGCVDDVDAFEQWWESRGKK